MREYQGYYSGKTVLITGGAGAIGSNLTREIAQLGAKVNVLDDHSASERWNVPSEPNVLFGEGTVQAEVIAKSAFFYRQQVR